jgi:hypothetical protein
MPESQPLSTVTGYLRMVTPGQPDVDIVIHPLEVKTNQPDKPGLVLDVKHDEPEVVDFDLLRIALPHRGPREFTLTLRGRPTQDRVYTAVSTNA